MHTATAIWWTFRPTFIQTIFLHLILLNSIDVIAYQCGFGGNGESGNGICLYSGCFHNGAVYQNSLESVTFWHAQVYRSQLSWPFCWTNIEPTNYYCLPHDYSNCCDLAARSTQGPLHFPYVVRQKKCLSHLTERENPANPWRTFLIVDSLQSYSTNGSF